MLDVPSVAACRPRIGGRAPISWHHSEDMPDRTASLEDTFLDWDFLALHVLPLLEAPGGAGDSG
jgi:hypothetical protein